jgi:putative CocE/NonD family hydrolase
VGGWFDAENLYGALECYRSVEASSPDCANALVMGPWRHGQWTRDDGLALGHVPFNAKTGEFYRQSIEFPFFQHHLKDKDDKYKQPEAWAFETGTNVWRTYDAWPPKTTRQHSLYLAAGGAFSPDKPRPTRPSTNTSATPPNRSPSRTRSTSA